MKRLGPIRQKMDLVLPTTPTTIPQPPLKPGIKPPLILIRGLNLLGTILFVVFMTCVLIHTHTHTKHLPVAYPQSSPFIHAISLFLFNSCLICRWWMCTFFYYIYCTDYAVMRLDCLNKSIVRLFLDYIRSYYVRRKLAKMDLDRYSSYSCTFRMPLE